MNTQSSRMFFMLELGGMGYRPQHKYKNLMKCYMMFMIIMFMLNYYFALLTWIYGNDDFVSRVGLLHYFLESAHITTKYLNVVLRYKEIRELLKYTDEVWASCKSDPDNQPLIEESDKTDRLFVRLVLIGITLVPVTFSTCTWLAYMITGVKKLPLLYWVPFDTVSYFWLALAFQMLIYLIPIMMFMGLVGFNVLLVMATVSQMKILRRLLTSRGSKANTRLPSYILHQNINKMVAKLNNLLSAQFVFEVSLTALQLSICILALFRAYIAGNTNLLATGAVLLLSMASPLVISVVGEMIQSESAKIFEAAYDNEWYNEEEKTKKELIVVLSKSRQPHTLHYRHVITFNMEQFGSLMQASYSYFTMLLQLSDLI